MLEKQATVDIGAEMRDVFLVNLFGQLNIPMLADKSAARWLI